MPAMSDSEQTSVATRVYSRITQAGRGSDFYLHDMFEGRQRSPREMTEDEHAQLLRRMVGALLVCVQDLAEEVEELRHRLAGP